MISAPRTGRGRGSGRLRWPGERLPTRQARPLALLTLAFQAGTILTAQTVGVVAPFVGWPGVLVSLGTCVAVVFLVVVATGLQILEKAL